MNESRTNPSPAKWQTCVRTIKCDFIDDYVSLMVKNDWTSLCTWYRQWKDPESKGAKGLKPNKETRKKITLCQGPDCSYVTGYRDELMKEERKAA
ncbi:MAG: hypothetical protein N3G78_09380 [Desulfobacterota bacterium]|nr:hypothetical protein [Thermodesulfobacteriota bacterium]